MTSAKEKTLSDNGSNDDKSRQRLGRGLASLIGGSGLAPRPAAATAGAASERSVAISSLRPNPNNPRRRFDEADLAELAASVKSHGVVQPILVRPVAEGGASHRFEIVAGERRWRAAGLAGLAQVPIVVRDLSDRETLEIAIIENVQRADLDAIEEAEAYDRLMRDHGYTQADLADALGKSRSHVANTLRLLNLPDAVRQMVSAGELSPGHARAAIGADDPEAFAREVAAGGLTVREAESRARGGQAPAPRKSKSSAKAPSAAPKPDAPAAASEAPVSEAEAAALAHRRAEVEMVERVLSDDLGYRVRLDPPNAGNVLHIHYDSPHRLAELVRLLKLAAGHRRDPRIRQL